MVLKGGPKSAQLSMMGCGLAEAVKISLKEGPVLNPFNSECNAWVALLKVVYF